MLSCLHAWGRRSDTCERRCGDEVRNGELLAT
jgi:hypothetical protein